MSTPTPVQKTAISTLYIAMFNRAPDASGLAFWAQALADGASIAGITQMFLSTPEGRSTYAASAASGQFVTAFYQTVFGRAPDAGGLAFWTGVLDNAGGGGSDAARATLVGQILAVVGQPLVTRPDGLSDAAYAQTVADRTTFAHKVEVAEYVVSLGIDNVSLARNTLALVTVDPASVATAKVFAANGGVVPQPPEPPVPIWDITSADLAAAITTKLNAYAANTATVNVTNMDIGQLVAVAGGIAKIAAAGIDGVMSLDLAGYASATVATLAPKLSASASLNVTGTASADTIALRDFAHSTRIDAGDGNDQFVGVVDATTPANTTLTAHHTLVGNAGTDVLQINVTSIPPPVGVPAVAVDALNGATLSTIETLRLAINGAATLNSFADVSLVQVSALAAGVAGSLTISNMAAGASLRLQGTAGDSEFDVTYAAGATAAGVVLQSGANAKSISLRGTDVTTASVQKTGAASSVEGIELSTGITNFLLSSQGDIGITALSGGAASGVAITVAGSGTMGISTINSTVSTFSASGFGGTLAVKFAAPVQSVTGGSGSNTLIVNNAATLTGGASADIFALNAGVALTGPVDNAGLLAKTATITNFASGDRLQIYSELTDTPGHLPVISWGSSPASLFAATISALNGLRVVYPTAPYVGFVYAGDSYIFADRGGDNVVGAGDTLVRLSGIVDLAGVSYDEYGLLTMA
ncbi:DUF4214 domain-containing protein [Pigmentiphaga aceris]|nr:DUF4214 domain-containing protein [Pigmentiphaga aceris]